MSAWVETANRQPTTDNRGRKFIPPEWCIGAMKDEAHIKFSPYKVRYETIGDSTSADVMLNQRAGKNKLLQVLQQEDVIIKGILGSMIEK